MSTVVKGARRSLIWLVVIVVALYGVLSFGVATHKTDKTPGLALDLAGGRTLTLQAHTTDGTQIDPNDLEQAVEVIRRRIDASGVSEAEISTQGSDTIIVSLPGNPPDSTIDLIRKSAQLQFRPVLLTTNATAPVATTTPTPSVTPTASATPRASATPSTSATPAASPTPSASATPGVSPSANPVPVAGQTDPSSYEWLTDALLKEYQALDCTKKANLGGAPLGDSATGHVACDVDSTGTIAIGKVAMGPVELTGSDIQTATSGPHYTSAGTLDGTYEVDLVFTPEGGKKFSDITKRLYDFNLAGDSTRDQFAIMLDGVVISHPHTNAQITGGKAQITGSFTRTEAEQLANQVKFGAIPLTLDVQSNDKVSATLGADQLQKGLIAGAIGLLLVVLYSMIQYRALGMVTVGSLLIAGAITYAVIALLSWGIGYRLSLAGIAGLIIAIGITADSFIVYFERVRDELREGRSLSAAIEHGWKRARRTILASDAVSFLAATVLYILAIGSVRGFAFTLGLTTLVDILVVFAFTHPILILLAKTKFFGEGHRLSGLDPRQLGRDTMYKGRGRVAPTNKPTLAERKAAASKGQAIAEPDSAGLKGEQP